MDLNDSSYSSGIIKILQSLKWKRSSLTLNRKDFCYEWSPWKRIEKFCFAWISKVVTMYREYSVPFYRILRFPSVIPRCTFNANSLPVSTILLVTFILTTLTGWTIELCLFLCMSGRRVPSVYRYSNDRKHKSVLAESIAVLAYNTFLPVQRRNALAVAGLHLYVYQISFPIPIAANLRIDRCKVDGDIRNRCLARSCTIIFRIRNRISNVLG